MQKKHIALVNIAIVFAVAQSLTTSNTSPTNLTLTSAAIIFLVLLPFWLSALYLIGLGRSHDMDMSISVSGSFWPVGKHPYQSFSLMAISFLLGGVGSIVRTLIIHAGSISFGAAFISIAGSLIAAIGIHRIFVKTKLIEHGANGRRPL